MEIYLIYGNDKIRLPVVPPTIGRQNSSSIDTKNIIKVGEVPVFGGRKLKKVDLNSFFPNQEYTFCSYRGFHKPYDFVNKLEKWSDNGYIARLIITGTNINMECIITDFNPTEQDGTGDVYYDISLVEYRRIEIPKYSTSNNNNTNTTNRPSTNNPNATKKTHTVKSGDTLSEIAKKYYGKGSLYPKIREKNKKKYPSLAKNTIIKIGWVLDI
jgi:LysM repeat protein